MNPSLLFFSALKVILPLGRDHPRLGSLESVTLEAFNINSRLMIRNWPQISLTIHTALNTTSDCLSSIRKTFLTMLMPCTKINTFSHPPTPCLMALFPTSTRNGHSCSSGRPKAETNLEES